MTYEPLLQGVPLFAGLRINGVATAVTGMNLSAGEQLWRQGDTADSLCVIETGRVAVTARLPGGRELLLAERGPGDVLGELALLGGGTRTAGVRALERTRLAVLGHRDFRAMLHSRDVAAQRIRRRLMGHACTRLAERHAALAARLQGELRTPPGERFGWEDHVAPALPDPAYLLRLPFLRQFTLTDLDRLMTHASVHTVPRGTVLLHEGERPTVCCITVTGAVEESIRRRETTIRFGLAGPGRAFGYGSLLADGWAKATATVAARERCTIITIASGSLEHALEEDPFATAMERDVVIALRQAERPQARLAAQDAIGPPPQRHTGR